MKHKAGFASFLLQGRLSGFGLFLFMDKLIKKTKLHFKGESDLKIDMFGVRGNGEHIVFPTMHHENSNKMQFRNWNQCLDFYKAIEGKMAILKDFKPGDEVKKTVNHLKAAGSEITDSKWTKIQAQMIRPDKFQKEDIESYEIWLAHNFRDRDGDRFNLDALKSLKKTIVGKSQLYGHDKRTVGDGIWYDARLEKVSADEAFDLVGPYPDKFFERHLKEIEELDGAIHFLVVDVYMLASNPVTEKIDAGIIKHTSIGFYAPEWVKITDQEGNTLWWEFQNTKDMTAEAIEASFVFLGAQPGSQVRKSVEAPNLKDFDNNNPTNVPKEQEVKTMELKFESIGYSKTIDVEKDSGAEKDLQLMQFQVDAKCADLDAAKKAAETAQETAEKSLKEFTDIFGEDGAETAKTANDLATEYKNSLVESALKYGKLAKQIAEDKADEQKEILEKLSIDELKSRIETYEDQYNKDNPRQSVVAENDEEHGSESKTEKTYDKASIQAPIV